VSDGFDPRAVPRRTLAGATILQIVPTLQEGPAARSAVNIAHVLLLSGARALIAAEGGPLVNEITAAGADWIPMVNATVNPFRLRGNGRRLEGLISKERIDIVHAYEAGAAWSARIAAAQIAVWVVTTLPDVPTAYTGMRGRYASALALGDRIISPSNYAAAPVIERFGVAPEQITIVPRVIDTAAYNAAVISTARIKALHDQWRVAADDRIIVVPGRVAPWNGQVILGDVARRLVDTGVRDFVFVIVGENTTHAKYAGDVHKRAQSLDVDDLFRMAGHCADLPAAFAAADLVAVPAIETPLLGRVVAQAQAVGRPVVTTDVGMLAELGVAPPRMPEDVRTGWVAKPGDAADFANALMHALALDSDGYRGACARARQFAEYMFSPESVADAMRSVYTSLLARDV
jgi:glycosyltransferase involved in cell wall biosynthesis